MSANKLEIDPREVKLEIITPLQYSWQCPECGNKNVDIAYSAPGKRRVECDFCGTLFIAHR